MNSGSFAADTSPSPRPTYTNLPMIPQPSKGGFLSTLLGGLLVATLLGVGVVGALLLWVDLDETLIWLPGDEEGQWIGPDRSFRMSANRESTEASYHISLPDAPRSDPLIIEVRALGRADLYLDGKRFAALRRPPARWRDSESFQLPPTDTASVLLILASNRSGPALIQVNSPESGLASTSAWQSRTQGLDWRPAIPVNTPVANPERDRFGNVLDSLHRSAPAVLSVFVFALLVQAWSRRPRKTDSAGWITSSRLRWLGMLAVLALGLHNLSDLPLNLGFDVLSHYEYLKVTRAGGLPSPDSGWQMFQAPLFYLVAGPLWHLISLIVSPEMAMRSLRLLTIGSSVLLVQLTYFASRIAFPADDDRQCIAVVVAAALGINLYMGQYVSNEPWAAVLGALLLVRCLRLLRDFRRAEWVWEPVLMGLIAGLAILAKVSALLLVGPALGTLLLARALNRPSRLVFTLAMTGGAFLGSIGLVSSWFFIRNLLLTGQFLHTINSDVSWWQGPGFRTATQLVSFGEALRAPILATTHGFWDGLYSTLWLDGAISSAVVVEASPPWNYDLVFATAWLSLLPTLGLILGVLIALSPSRRRDLIPLFSTACVFLYLIAILYVYVRLPIYSAAKASYCLALTPLLGILIAVGLGPLVASRWTRAATWSGITTWALVSFFSYWIT